jgi:uncharacterized protein YndB with AHSA1/START domain
MPSVTIFKGGNMPTTGTYENASGQPIVRFERTFPHPVRAVWKAITDPDQLEQWFPTTVEFDELRAGSPIAFRFAQGAYPPLRGSVLDVQPERRLSFTWGDDVLTFELQSQKNGAACRLSFSVVLDSADKAARDGAGWEQCLDSLELVVDGTRPEHPLPTDAWRAYYEEYRRLGLPATAPLPQ